MSAKVGFFRADLLIGNLLVGKKFPVQCNCEEARGEAISSLLYLVLFGVRQWHYHIEHVYKMYFLLIRFTFSAYYLKSNYLLLLVILANLY
eukprot:scaffold15228_cov123-Skeletonema_marinoi.AAC.2